MSSSPVHGSLVAPAISREAHSTPACLPTVAGAQAEQWLPNLNIGGGGAGPKRFLI